MRILDRYVLTEVLKILVVAVVAFMAVFDLVDLFDNIDTYMDRSASITSVLRYYAYLAPWELVLVLPVAALLATLLAVGNLARHRELVAMKASGVSLYRIMVPLLVLGCVLTLAVTILGETVVPRANALKRHVRRVEIRGKKPRPTRRSSNLYHLGRQGQVYFARRASDDNSLGGVVVLERVGAGRLSARLDAARATWQGDVWMFHDGYLRHFRSGREYVLRFERAAFSHLDDPPADLRATRKDPEEMDFFGLRERIRRLRRGGQDARREEVDLLFKLSFPLANLVVVLVGAPLAAHPRRGGVGVGFGLSLTLSFLYYGFFKASQALGYAGDLPPLVAAWLPNVVFLAGGALGLLKART
jgi:lipopolysaccharide export system permease protein